MNFSVNSIEPDVSVSPIDNIRLGLISIEIIPSTGCFGIVKLHIKLNQKKQKQSFNYYFF